MTVLCGQKLPQQGPAHTQHRLAHHKFHRLQPVPASAGRHGKGRQPVYLGGELRLDLRVEPPFSPSGSADGVAGRGCGIDAPGGRASQIASLTSTIWSLMSANRK
jgi:hypothetical protein